MASDIVAQLADSLAKAGVEDGELSYKGQGRKLDDAQSGESQLLWTRTCDGSPKLYIEAHLLPSF